MAHAQEIQLQITEPESGDKGCDSRDEPEPDEPPTRRLPRSRGVRWWALVAVDMLMLLAGGTVATLLSRLYYNSGGNSKWMSTLTQSCGAPLLAIPLLLTPPAPEEERRRPAPSKLAAVYLGIGVLIGVDNLMYAYALLYLPVSTFSLVAATQLAFNAVTSRLINAQRFTPLIANSVVVLTFAAAMLGVGASSDGDGTSSSGAPPRGRYAAGFVLTLAASAVLALILSLYELAFERVVRARTPRWVLRTQMHTNLVASAVAAAGLLASGEWRTVPGEMAAFRDGPARYVLTLAGTAAAWQAALAGQVRLVARVSSLFANATGAVQLPLVPVFAVVLFGDRMTGVKTVAMLMAVWGFLSYVYQHYLDGRRAAAGKDGAECAVCAARAASNAVSSAS
ncbi:probable purine permease 11 isoform X2 [Panicum virgatum]|uniref:probable purine permease 11 isoform X2 n=1 Tax=Panicum virgatum TaxID=38727 RepID=UPI0019D69A7A|nr:probable purine permease 11 isoform X2 [Panicum virgatum]